MHRLISSDCLKRYLHSSCIGALQLRAVHDLSSLRRPLEVPITDEPSFGETTLSDFVSMSSRNLLALAAKLSDADSDIRYMSLNDMVEQLVQSPPGGVAIDTPTCNRLADGILRTLEDTNGEVQNLAIKTLGPFVAKCHPDVLHSFVNSITQLSTSDVEGSVSATAIKAIITSFPRPSASTQHSKTLQNAYAVVSDVIIPRLVGRQVVASRSSQSTTGESILENDVKQDRDSNYIDVLAEVARCFGPMLRSQEIEALQAIVLSLLSNPNTPPVMRKKATAALAVLAQHFSDALLSTVVSHMIQILRDPHLVSSTRRLHIAAFGAMARTIPTKFGPHLKTISPFVLAPLSQTEMDEQTEKAAQDEEHDPAVEEVREAALLALEAFLASCPEQVRPYQKDTLDAALRYVRYDPNYAALEDEEDDFDAEDDFDLDEDFEQEGGADDEDDLSWKVRRCAAKCLYALIAARGSTLLDDNTAYDRMAHVLVDSMKEREEGVRLEILSTLAYLIRRTGEAEGITTDLSVSSQPAPPSDNSKRKRRRARRRSDVSMMDAPRCKRMTGSESPDGSNPAQVGPSSNLALVGPDIVAGALKLLQNGPLATKQSALLVLRDYVVASQGGLSAALQQLIPLAVSILRSSTEDTAAGYPSAGAISSATIQVECLKLLSDISKFHSSMEVSPHLSSIISEVQSAAQGKTSGTAIEALKLMEQLIKLITPPRSAASSHGSAVDLARLLSITTELILSKAPDSAVRNEAIRIMGILLGRSASTSLISESAKSDSLNLLLECTKNEITRYASIKAVDTMVRLAPSQYGYNKEWTGQVCIEMGVQLRKADRALRGAALQALRVLLVDKQCGASLDAQSAHQLASLLVPQLTSDDLHLIGPSLLVLAAMIHADKTIASDDLIKHVCDLMATPLAGSVIDQLSEIMEVIGSQGIGATLMQIVLKDVSLKATSTVVGKLIGDLLVAGGKSVGITIDAFLQEAKTAPDEKRKCLALTVLGEVGLRSGESTAAVLNSELFTAYFQSPSTNVSLAAATAFGRVAAGEGNAKNYIPVILADAKDPKSRYLLLHAIKEVLQWISNPDELDPFLDGLWEVAVSASIVEDNRPVGAECLANLAILSSRPYLQRLHVCAASPLMIISTNQRYRLSSMTTTLIVVPLPSLRSAMFSLGRTAPMIRIFGR